MSQELSVKPLCESASRAVIRRLAAWGGQRRKKVEIGLTAGARIAETRTDLVARMTFMTIVLIWVFVCSICSSSGSDKVVMVYSTSLLVYSASERHW